MKAQNRPVGKGAPSGQIEAQGADPAPFFAE
jgi:hypothetical protein